MSRSEALEPRRRRPLDERFGALKGLMHALEVVALAGQEHVINKMLVILRGDVLRLESPIGAADLISLGDAMTDLEHEAGRFAPTPRIFNGHVATAIEVLTRSGVQ